MIVLSLRGFIWNLFNISKSKIQKFCFLIYIMFVHKLFTIRVCCYVPVKLLITYILTVFLTCHVPASTPMLLQLSPLIAVALGAVGSVILLVLAVVAALRLRRRHEKKPGDSTKHSSESNDSVEKNPDIIPLSNGKNTYYIHLTVAQRLSV